MSNSYHCHRKVLINEINKLVSYSRQLKKLPQDNFFSIATELYSLDFSVENRLKIFDSCVYVDLRLYT